MSTATMKTIAPAASKNAGRKSASLPQETVEYLKAWMMSPEHVAHPYPTEQEKAQIMAETGIELKQLTNWFVNNRKRYWKPRVEAKLSKFGAGAGAAAGGTTGSPSQLQGNGGLSISIHHLNPKAAQATSFPMLPAGSASFPNSRRGSGTGLASALPSKLFGPAAVAAAFQNMGSDDPHTVSDGSGTSACNSDDDSVSVSSRSTSEARRPSISFGAPGSTVLVSGGYRRHEEVDIHILRPDNSLSSDNNSSDAEPLPCLRDLTIKTSIPKERILATFKCPISYVIPYEIENDRKKVQSRRDGEVLRVKKHYLKLYLATRGIHSVSSPVGGDFSRQNSGASVNSSAEVSNVCSVTPSSNPAPAKVESSSRTRSLTCTDLFQDSSESPRSLPPRKRARTASGSFMRGDEEWKMLCQTARSLYCESLPSLEEAARMFGYVSP